MFVGMHRMGTKLRSSDTFVENVRKEKMKLRSSGIVANRYAQFSCRYYRFRHAAPTG